MSYKKWRSDNKTKVLAQTDHDDGEQNFRLDHWFWLAVFPRLLKRVQRLNARPAVQAGEFGGKLRRLWLVNLLARSGASAGYLGKSVDESYKSVTFFAVKLL